MKKIGIYSGSFDPVHNGHILFAKEAVHIFGLDRVYFLVEPRPRRKQGVKAFEHRVNMVKLAVQDDEKLGTLIINQDRFTPHETLQVLLSRFNGSNLYMLMGDDMLNHLADWPHVEELLSSLSFIIGARKRSEEEVNQIISKLIKSKGLNLGYEVFVPTGHNYSSSALKRELKRNSIPKGVNKDVFEYIMKNQLYFPASE